MDNQLHPGVGVCALERQQLLNYDVAGSSPLDGFGKVRAMYFAKIYKLKVERAVLSMLRLQPELEGNAGHFRWLRTTRPLGTQVMVRDARIQNQAYELPEWVTCQGLSDPGVAPDSSNAPMIIGGAMQQGGQVMMIPKLAAKASGSADTTAPDQPEAGEEEAAAKAKAKSKAKAKAKRIPQNKFATLPLFSLEGALYNYRAAVTIAQTTPNNWDIIVPSVLGFPATISGMGYALGAFDVQPAGVNEGDITDVYSICLKQKWITQSTVAFGRNYADMTPAIRRNMCEVLAGTRHFGVAGCKYPFFNTI